MWSLTWREYSALKRVWLDSRNRVEDMYANLRSDMWNHWFRDPKTHPEVFTAGDFTGRKPKPKPEEPGELPYATRDWKTNRMIIGMMLHAASERNEQKGAN